MQLTSLGLGNFAWFKCMAAHKAKGQGKGDQEVSLNHDDDLRGELVKMERMEEDGSTVFCVEIDLFISDSCSGM